MPGDTLYPERHSAAHKVEDARPGYSLPWYGFAAPSEIVHASLIENAKMHCMTERS